MSCFGCLTCQDRKTIKRIPEEIRIDTLIRENPDCVFSGTATAVGSNSWFTQGTEMEKKQGGKILFRWVNWGPDRVSAEEEGIVLVYQPAVELTYQKYPDHVGHLKAVQMKFKHITEGTVLRLQETGYEGTPEEINTMLGCASGWEEALTLFKFYLELGITN